MYLFSEKINWDNWYFFSKDIVLNYHWANLPPSTRAILPVIMMFRNKNTGEAFPSHQTIGALAGLSEKSVSKGIKSIESLDDFDVKTHRTSKGNKAFKYVIPKYEGDGLIKINHSLFASGYWRELTPTAKSVYIVLRVLAEYDEWSFELSEEDDFTEFYKTRKWDLVRFQSRKQIADLAGITTQSLTAAIKSLKEHDLICDHPEEEYEQVIYLAPKDRSFYKRSYLNKKLKESFQHKQKRL